MMILLHLKYFKIVPFDAYKQGVKEQYLYSWILSILGPAIIIDPTKDILTCSNLAATFCHIFFAISLYSSSFISPNIIGINNDSLSTYQPILLYLTSIVALSHFLVMLLKEEHRQLIGLKMPWLNGSLCCENNDQLVWAIKRRYLKLLDLYSKLQNPNSIEFDPNGKKIFSNEDLKAIFEAALLLPKHGQMLRDSLIDRSAYHEINPGNS